VRLVGGGSCAASTQRRRTPRRPRVRGVAILAQPCGWSRIALAGVACPAKGIKRGRVNP